MNTRLDHLIVVARDLAQGVAWAQARLGVTPAPGGSHALMGTHNRLLKLDGPSHAYLEIIAIDPEAPAPGRPRWFGIDDLQAAVQDAPRLVHLAARTDNLDMHRFGLVAAGLNAGRTLAVERATAHGLLRWRIVVPDDGRPLCGGALPTLIEWQGRHPAQDLPDSGIALHSLTLRGLPEQAADVLRLQEVELQALPGAAVEARLATAHGLVTLSSAAP